MDDKVIALFLERIQDFRDEIDTIYLFGSQVRGTARPNSDYDLLIVIPQKDRRLKDKLYLDS
ncbi:MAG: nucleotidyltransferase domain-containing protein [bacterium]